MRKTKGAVREGGPVSVHIGCSVHFVGAATLVGEGAWTEL